MHLAEQLFIYCVRFEITDIQGGLKANTFVQFICYFIMPLVKSECPKNIFSFQMMILG